MRRRPGGGLLHPVALVAMALLAANDHVFKRAFAAPWTGKLSDVAGLVVAPLLLVALVELFQAARGRFRGPSARVLGLAVLFTAAGFALVKVVPAAGELYRHGLALLQWPFRGAYAPVALAPDATDLLALPSVLIAWWVGRARLGEAARGGALEKLVAGVAAVLCAATSAPEGETWSVLGVAEGPRLVIEGPMQPERFLVVYSIPLAALPPGNVGLFNADVTARLEVGSLAVVDFTMLDPPLGPVQATLDVPAPVGASIRGVPRNQLRCDATACAARAEVKLTAPSRAEVTWATSAHFYTVADTETAPPAGAEIGIAIMAID